MIILVPKYDINKYISQLTVERLNKYTSSAKYARAKVKISVFKTEYKSDLVSTLKRLGMNLPFDSKNADFNGIKNNEIPIWLGNVFHNCVVSVDEEGTDAAALSSVDICGSPLIKDIKEFYVNKPFIFLIKDDTSNIILFIGKVNNLLN